MKTNVSVQKQVQNIHLSNQIFICSVNILQRHKVFKLSQSKSSKIQLLVRLRVRTQTGTVQKGKSG